MKLSEMPLDKARDCMVELAPCLSALTSDPEVLAFFDGEKRGDNPIAEIIGLVGKLLKDHYETLVMILSVLSGESKAAIRKKPVSEVIALARSVYDEDLRRFFTS